MHFRLFSILVFLLIGASQVWSHALWTQRNEPGPWTVALYHLDEEELTEGALLYEAQDGSGLDLVIGAHESGELRSVSARAAYLHRALSASVPVALISENAVEHPINEMSIEVWLRFLSVGADIQIGLLEGVSMRIQLDQEGDRFHLLGANSEDLDDQTYSAPELDFLPRFPIWVHLGVTISAPSVESVGDGRYRYGPQCRAMFFFSSHAIGFIDNMKISLEGLEFEEQARPAILIHEGELFVDEVQISRIDWSDPIGHGGEGHGEFSIPHAFENGRIPVSVQDWALY